MIYRVKIKPYKVYPRYISEWDALDKLPLYAQDVIWSLIYRKLKAQRGCTPINFQESERLIKMIEDANNGNALILNRNESLTYDEENKEIKKRRYNIKLAPETTGKKSQFSGLDELLRLKKETNCSICIDFAHLYARNAGNIDYDHIFKKVKHIKHLHCHFSGITYTEKGERSHKILDKQFFIPLAKAIKKYKPASMTIINESPNQFGDAVKMKKWLEEK